MPHVLYVAGAGVVHFSDRMTRAELDAALAQLMQADATAYGELVQRRWWEDSTTGVRVDVDWYEPVPADAVDIARLLATAAAEWRSAVDLRVKWFRQSGPPFVLTPGTETTPHLCLACGDPLRADLLFGRCRACATALNIVLWEDGVTLPDRQCQ